jgi:hypothetical protein
VPFGDLGVIRAGYGTDPAQFELPGFGTHLASLNERLFVDYTDVIRRLCGAPETL